MARETATVSDRKPIKESSMDKYTILNWIAETNYSAMMLLDGIWWAVWSTIFLLGSALGMSPLKTHHEHSFIQIILVKVRQGILITAFLMCVSPLIMLYIYDVSMLSNGDNIHQYLNWFFNLVLSKWYLVPASIFAGLIFRFLFHRYYFPALSKLLRKIRHTQTHDTPSDIRLEQRKFKAKSYDPTKKYNDKSIFVGVDIDGNSLSIPNDTWYETNMEVVGPTRYGKGIILGNIMDQAIRRGDGLVYIDPKEDKYAPYIMYNACKETGREFYYLTLHDEGIGKWAPFAGGTARDGFARAEKAFGLEYAGSDADFYKSGEQVVLNEVFGKTRNIEGMANEMSHSDAQRLINELNRWKHVKSLCPKKGRGFSIENALLNNAVVYVQGSLTDSVVKTATKVFIMEVIQEAKRLDKSRNAHMTFIIDEVRFLVSNTLADALATIVGSRVNIVTALQSIGDLLNPDDKTINGKSLLQSVNVNSQIKAVYGGQDIETAEWASKTSGTIQKEVTKLERTNVDVTGGETWEPSRMIAKQEESHLHANMILTLPPRVCALFQPNKLSEICFTAPVPVAEKEPLEMYLESKHVHSIPAEIHPGKGKVPHAEQTQKHTDNPETEDDDQTEIIHIMSGKMPDQKAVETEVPHAELQQKSIPEDSQSMQGKNKYSDENNTKAATDSNGTAENGYSKVAKNRDRKLRQKEKKRQAKQAPNNETEVPHAEQLRPARPGPSSKSEQSNSPTLFANLQSDDDILANIASDE